jgi:hypothetical protein
MVWGSNLVMTLLLVASGSSGALLRQGVNQVLPQDIPVHAHYNATEQGWSCNEGFRQVAGFCVRDTQGVASQSIFEVFDGQWRCRAGYRRMKGVCVPLTAPAHATFVGHEGRWECDWGFRKAGSRCEEIEPPAHAYLEASGDDWACFPGFERVSDHCVAIPGTTPAPPSTQHAKG